MITDTVRQAQVEYHVEEAAFNELKTIRSELYDLKEEARETYFQEAERIRLLKGKWKDRGYARALFGFDTWEAFVAAPQDAGGLDRSRKATDEQLRIYEKFGIELKLKWNDPLLEGMDKTKLDILTRVVTPENYREWLENARGWSRSDLLKEVKEVSGEGEDDEGNNEGKEEKDVGKKSILSLAKRVEPERAKEVLVRLIDAIEHIDADVADRLLKDAQSWLENNV